MKVDQIPVEWKLSTVPLLRTSNKISHIPVSGEQDMRVCSHVDTTHQNINKYTHVLFPCPFVIPHRPAKSLNHKLLSSRKFLGQIPYSGCLFFF
jgi:hypothetical protein